jgi:hypothetical protein
MQKPGFRFFLIQSFLLLPHKKERYSQRIAAVEKMQEKNKKFLTVFASNEKTLSGHSQRRINNNPL